MIVVIIAGGAGTRLWPLSTAQYPKHLLKVDGDASSLLQNTYKRALQVGGEAANVYVVSEAGHIHHVKEQLSELPDNHFIVEPTRRGTASCMAAALVSIAANGHSREEPIAFIPADHHIRDMAGFVQSFKRAGNVSGREGRIVLIGVEPDYPATGFGYIQKGTLLSEDTYIYDVVSFKEKPDHKQAQEYIGGGQYLWNCSYHIGSIGMFEAMLRDSAPDLFANYQQLQKATPDNYEATYLQFDTISIEYALTEKAQNLLVMPASFDWMDLGSFADMYRAVDSDEAGNYTYGLTETEEVENSFIHNQEQKPLAVIGLDNIVVINSPNGILVVRKDLSQKVGDISKRFDKAP